jgi:hypothetical protein
MSAYPPKADIRQRLEHVCLVPIADIAASDTTVRLPKPFYRSSGIPAMTALRPQVSSVMTSPLLSSLWNKEGLIRIYQASSSSQSSQEPLVKYE